MTSAIASLAVDECDRDTARVAIPRPDVQLIVRFGPAALNGIDAHAFGIQPTVHRKTIRAGQRAVTARLHPGASAAVFGVPADALAGQIVELETLWGLNAAARLYDRLSAAQTTFEAAAIVEGAIAERLAGADASDVLSPLAVRARERLGSTSVNAVAGELGVSERHFRRVFRKAVGVSPKSFAKLARFQRAVGAARANLGAGWAGIAAEAGYYDQAHLIDEFRAIAGVTPRALLDELGVDSAGAPQARAADR